MEYLIIGIGTALIVLTFLIYQKVSKKKDLETDYKETLGNIFKQLGAIEKVQEDFKDIQDNIIDFRNLFNNKTERGKLGEEYLEDIIKDLKFLHCYSRNLLNWEFPPFCFKNEY